MALVTLHELTIGFRGPVLLDAVNCQIEAGQRIGLLGRNGAGKTTFMRILRGEVEPDAGVVQLAPQMKVSLLPQDVPQDVQGNIADVVAPGLSVFTDDDEDEEGTEWKQQQRVTQILARMKLDGQSRLRYCQPA